MTVDDSIDWDALRAQHIPRDSRALWDVQCAGNPNVRYEMIGPSKLKPICCPMCGGPVHTKRRGKPAPSGISEPK